MGTTKISSTQQGKFTVNGINENVLGILGNMTRNEESKQTDSELMQILELAGKDIKTAIITVP